VLVDQELGGTEYVEVGGHGRPWHFTLNRASRHRVWYIQDMEIFIATLFLISCCYTTSPDVVVSEAPAVYCYATIGEPDCYAEPRPEETGRLIGGKQPGHPRSR
jgi:hypothetical protein